MSAGENTKKETINDLRERIIGIPVVGLFGMLLSKGNGLAGYIESFLLSIFFTFSLWHLMRYLVIRLRTKFPGVSNTRKRIIRQIGIGIPVTVIFMTGFCFIYGFIKFGTEIPLKPIVINGLVGLLITLFISTIFECVYFFEQWKSSLLEAQELQSKQMVQQLGASLNDAINRMGQLHEGMMQMQAQTMQQIEGVRNAATAPKRVIRGADGKVVGVEVVQ
jgi:hypothetical protein